MFKDLGWSWSLVSYISWTLKRGMFGRNFHDWTELLLFLWERSAGDKKTCLKKNTGARWLRLSTNTIIKVTGAWEKWWLCWSLYTCSISCLCHFSNSVAQSERENRSEVVRNTKTHNQTHYLIITLCCWILLQNKNLWNCMKSNFTLKSHTTSTINTNLTSLTLFGSGKRWQVAVHTMDIQYIHLILYKTYRRN